MLLERELQELLDDLLLEEWPPILHNLESSWKTKLSEVFYLGKNSTQEKISVSDATKKPYNTGLIIITDSDYQPKYAFYGSKFISFGGYHRRKPTRKKAMESVEKYNGKIYYISPDIEAYKKYQEREQRPANFAPTKKKYQEKEAINQYTKLMDKYFNKKLSEFESLAPSIKEHIIKELRKKKEEQYENLKDSFHQLNHSNEVLEPNSDDLSNDINDYANKLNNLYSVDADTVSAYSYGLSREKKARIKKDVHTTEVEIPHETINDITKELGRITARIKKKIGRE